MSGDVPEGVQRDYPLARLTTIRTGGPAELFARPGTVAALEAVLAWAGDQGVEVGVVGSGSNLLVADAGVRGLVLKLDHELTQIAVEGTRMHCGGGARLPAVSAQAARAGLSGIEFGVNIPGTVGGAVRMNANAYGGELARAL
jgi:UDP-N-acetylmuramate dehydrogenase